MMKLRPNQVGDTIVEVLIAIAIISSILGGAFSATNYSSNNIRGAQERSEALNLVQGQVEQIKAFAAGSQADTTVFRPPASTRLFCFNNLGEFKNATTTNINTPPTPDDLSGYTGDCSLQPLGGVTYYVSVEYSPSTNTFTTRCRWDRVGGGQDELTIAYKVFK